MYRLRTSGEFLGPVLDVPLRARVEFIVPAGTARTWPQLLGTVCVGPGVIRCPVSHVTWISGRGAVCGRRWIVPPAADVPVTDGDVLCEAVTAAIAHRARLWIDELRTLSAPVQGQHDGL
ncbi:hypothetical protein [Streptomyces gobiensis]|uniref:hypothetical protein n=1 Tax=Streptomyces gobiensis TaxID=2875706 RepID=UPI001E345187|nr:hypothetical protein [Streptomyces gobiensis]UGY90281.1 hypothetical protein test1122_00080 [Streptomyces gobiensis]UGY94930.1 hypothetical protein test1122_26460 [Streptomyces gobiensis]